MKRYDRVRAKRNIFNNGDLVAKRGETGQVIHTGGPFGYDVRWDRGFYSVAKGEDLEKI